MQGDIIMETKTCSCCHQTKPTSEFAGDKYRPDGFTCQCKSCIRLRKKKYRQTEKGKATEKRYQQSEKGKKVRRNIDLKHNFGITIKEYNKLFKEQKGHCAICDKHQSELKCKLHVDHNHTNHVIRGLLCKLCNSRLGWLENNKEQILDYIK